MTTQLKLRRGTTAQHSSFTGAQGEITVDTTKNVAVVHDGATAGGIPQAREDGSNASGTWDISITGNAATATQSTKIANTGGWNVTPTGTKLYFNFNGTNVGSLDSSGNFIVSGNITGFGTP